MGTSLWLGKMSRAEGQRRQPGFSTRMPACGAAGWGWGRMTGGQTEGRRAGERVCRQVWGASPGLANGRPSAGHSMHSGAAHPRGTAHAAAPLPAAAAALPGGRWGPTRLHKTRQGARSGASFRRGAASKFTQPAGGPSAFRQKHSHCHHPPNHCRLHWEVRRGPAGHMWRHFTADEFLGAPDCPYSTVSSGRLPSCCVMKEKTAPMSDSVCDAAGTPVLQPYLRAEQRAGGAVGGVSPCHAERERNASGGHCSRPLLQAC